MKTHSTVMSELLEISENSYFRWKKKDHSVLIKLLEKYFTKEDLIEFLNTNKVDRLEKTNFIELIKEKNRNKYLTSFLNGGRYENLSLSHNIFIDFYFSFLLFLKDQPYNNSLNLLLQEYLVTYSLEQYELSILRSFKTNYNELQKFHKQFQEEYESEKIDNYQLTKDVFDDLHKHINKDLIERLQKHFFIFSNWDDYMFLFLKDIMNNDMFDLYNLDDKEETKKEAVYHIIGYYIYSHIGDELKSGGKVRLISYIYNNLEVTTFNNKNDLLQKIDDLQSKYLKLIESNETLNIELL